MRDLVRSPQLAVAQQTECRPPKADVVGATPASEAIRFRSSAAERPAVNREGAGAAPVGAASVAESSNLVGHDTLNVGI